MQPLTDASDGNATVDQEVRNSFMEADGDHPSRSAELDLSGIVTRLSRVKEKNRARLANSDLTRAFLGSALALADETFRVGPSLAPSEPGSSALYPSRAKVLERTKACYPELIPTEAKFRDRWAGQQDFIADFVAYALSDRHHRMQIALTDCLNGLLDSNLDLSTALHRFADEVTRLMIGLPGYRIQLFATAAASVDPTMAEALQRMYSSLSDTWTGMYRELVTSFGFKLRPGADIEHLTIVVLSVLEGVGLRFLAGLEEQPAEDDREISVPGTALLALFVAFIDAGDGLTLEQASNRKIAPKLPL